VESLRCKSAHLALLLAMSIALCGSGPAELVVEGPSGGKAARVDPAARLPAGDSGWEYWDLLFRLDTGHVVAMRFLVTNRGPGDQNGVAIGQVIRPDGSVLSFDNGRRKQRWTLDEDRLRLDIGSSHLDLRAPAHRLEIDKKAVKLDLRYAPQGWAAAPAGLTPDGYYLDVIDAAAPVEGSLWVEGMQRAVSVNGRVGVTHTWGREPEASQVLRRLDFFSLGNDEAMLLIDLTRPTGRRTRWLSSRGGAEEFFEASNFELSLEGSLADRDNSSYWMPAGLRARGASLQGDVSFARTLTEMNPLATLPAPIRLLMSLGGRPHRVWVQADYDLSLGAAPGTPHRQGTGLAVVTFQSKLEPAPRALRR
jgi:hypothetical protein